jgi:hypothetical protein
VVRALVRHKNRHANNIGQVAARFIHDRFDILQRFLKLLNQIKRVLDFPRRVHPRLTREKQNFSATRENAICIAGRFCK